ncbi:MAG TPA: hypothetical protein VFQ00_11055 [Terriglobales bacterium]|nr:hypothetical protein [Terriglobales bacterium]
MTTASHLDISQFIHEVANAAQLSVGASAAGTDFAGAPTVRFELSSPSGESHTLELSSTMSAELENKTELRQEFENYLQTLARRLRSAAPNLFLTLHGIPLRLEQFRWPYHHSTSGADSFILHGVAQLAEPESPLHAKVAPSLTVTFAEVLPSLEQPYAEGVTYNAVRKTLDLSQLELLKSGNRQPVPVSTRYYSFRQKRFIFNETSNEQRKQFLKAKVFWNSVRLENGKPAWITDPYDAQYLDATLDELRQLARELVNEEFITVDDAGEYASAAPKLVAQSAQFLEKMNASLALLKPKFNEEMRAGHTNM